MLYGLLGMAIGGLAILFTKFVLPKMNAKMEQQAAEQKAKRDAKRAAKEAQKDSDN